MKRIIQRVALLFIVTGVFFSSVGITIFKHTCSASKFSKTSFFGVKSCCADNPVTGVKPNCCQTKFTWHRVESEKRISEKLNITLLFAEVPAVVSFTLILNNRSSQPDAFCMERPPPLTGRVILSLKQSFLI
jgi:hypothetical protein